MKDTALLFRKICSPYLDCSWKGSTLQLEKQIEVLRQNRSPRVSMIVFGNLTPLLPFTD